MAKIRQRRSIRAVPRHLPRRASLGVANPEEVVTAIEAAKAAGAQALNLLATPLFVLFGWIRQMNIGIQAVTWSGSMTLVGLLVSACVSSDRATSSATARSGAPWAQNLSEAPPSREPVSDTAARLGAELTAARERASR